IPALEDPRTLLRPGFIARPQPAVIESAGSDALPADGMARIVGGRSPQADKSAREIAMCLTRRESFVTIGLEFRGLPAYGGACLGRRLVLHNEHDESQRARRGRKAFPLREGRVPGATAGLTARGKWGHTPLSLPGRTARRRKWCVSPLCPAQFWGAVRVTTEGSAGAGTGTGTSRSMTTGSAARAWTARAWASAAAALARATSTLAWAPATWPWTRAASRWAWASAASRRASSRASSVWGAPPRANRIHSTASSTRPPRMPAIHQPVLDSRTTTVSTVSVV